MGKGYTDVYRWRRKNLQSSNRIRPPVSWSDNWQEDGIWDLNGNVYEWQGGYRTVDGEIQIIPDNNAAKQISQGSESTLWKAIMPDGSLVDPGTPGTLKWDYSNPVPEEGSGEYAFKLNTVLENPTQNTINNTE